ncbi:polysaccharide deacetylase family protein [Streptomyces sp. NPDC017179]|uniref:polysaccharide deacetylase family protein n=1 Tax=Streptomyces sp. NPDC017179 TaxID=3364979 RepID=UPI0037985748
MALAFDGSPGVRTPRILDIPRRYRVHATFFTLGRHHAATYPAMVVRAAAEGHEVETLTWSHRVLTVISRAEAHEEITRGREAVARVIGRRPVLLRPPEGRTSAAVTAICRRPGMAQVLWSATASDYGPPTPRPSPAGSWPGQAPAGSSCCTTGWTPPTAATTVRSPRCPASSPA